MPNSDQLVSLNSKIKSAQDAADRAERDNMYIDSTSELGIQGGSDIGHTWIDGKTIYRTVIDLTADATGLNLQGPVAVQIDVSSRFTDSTNFDSLIDFRCPITSGSILSNLSYLDGLSVLYLPPNIVFSVLGEDVIDLSIADQLTVIIEYTKLVE